MDTRPREQLGTDGPRARDGTRSCAPADRWSGGLAEPGGRERSNASRGLPIPFIAGTEGKKVLRRSLMISSSVKRRIEMQVKNGPAFFATLHIGV